MGNFSPDDCTIVYVELLDNIQIAKVSVEKKEEIRLILLTKSLY